MRSPPRGFPISIRFGPKAGQPNQDFLNADLFATAFLKPCEDIRQKVGVLMFEFSRFWPSDYAYAGISLLTWMGFYLREQSVRGKCA